MSCGSGCSSKFHELADVSGIQAVHVLTDTCTGSVVLVFAISDKFGLICLRKIEF